jgi:hypothetical protein
MTRMPREPIYKFGSFRYTLDQIHTVGYQHGRGKMTYCPPQCWGKDARVHPGQLGVPFSLDDTVDNLEAAYYQGFASGYYSVSGEFIEELQRSEPSYALA